MMIRLIDILLDDMLTERSFVKKIGDLITGRKPKPDVKPYVERKPGDVWQTAGGRWAGMNRRGNISYYANREAAEKYSKKQPRKTESPQGYPHLKASFAPDTYGQHFKPKPNPEDEQRKRRGGIRFGIGGGGFGGFGGGGGFSGGGGGSSF
jgi:uncharacterized membrane protein YgcG